MKKGMVLYLVASSFLLNTGMASATSSGVGNKCTVKPCRVANERLINNNDQYPWTQCGITYLPPVTSLKAIITWFIS